MFVVRVADNFHYMDASETYTHGEFATWAEAVAVSRGIVDAFLVQHLKPGIDAERLFELYIAFGDDPHIAPVPEGESFSAWGYAELRCTQLCAPNA